MLHVTDGDAAIWYIPNWNLQGEVTPTYHHARFSLNVGILAVRGLIFDEIEFCRFGFSSLTEPQTRFYPQSGRSRRRIFPAFTHSPWSGPHYQFYVEEKFAKATSRTQHIDESIIRRRRQKVMKHFLEHQNR
jgi:hypothetical protein